MLQLIGTIVSAVMTSCAPLIAFALLKTVSLQNDARAVQLLSDALDYGTGLALAHAQQIGDALLHEAQNKAAALEIAVGYCVAAAGHAIAHLHVTDEALLAQVKATLANKLHVAHAVLAANPPAAAPARDSHGRYVKHSGH